MLILLVSHFDGVLSETAVSKNGHRLLTLLSTGISEFHDTAS